MGVDHTTLGPSCGAVFPRAAPCLRALTPTGAPLKLQDLILAEGSNAVCHSSAFVRTHFASRQNRQARSETRYVCS